ncbi:Uncharacterised protein [uncultured archaeon]|nr:Uncharacterised protein [uncultured archaeon]
MIKDKYLATTIRTVEAVAGVGGVAALTFPLVGALCDAYLGPGATADLVTNVTTTMASIVAAERLLPDHPAIRGGLELVIGAAGGSQVLGTDLPEVLKNSPGLASTPILGPLTTLANSAIDKIKPLSAVIGAALPSTVNYIRYKAQQRAQRGERSRLVSSLKVAGALLGGMYLLGNEGLDHLTKAFDYIPFVGDYLKQIPSLVKSVPETYRHVTQFLMPYFGAKILMRDPKKHNQVVKYATQMISAGVGIYELTANMPGINYLSAKLAATPEKIRQVTSYIVGPVTPFVDKYILGAPLAIAKAPFKGLKKLFSRKKSP